MHLRVWPKRTPFDFPGCSPMGTSFATRHHPPRNRRGLPGTGMRATVGFPARCG
jgi:hypothetical protein